MNRTLKETLAKLTIETGGVWMSLPLDLYRVCNIPYTWGLTPFEIMYRRPLPILPNLKADVLTEISNKHVLDSLETFARTQRNFRPN